MPQETQNSPDLRQRARPSIADLWHNFHFSGRVIMCSVLFGLGIILIGGLILTIEMIDGKSTSENQDEEVPTSQPSTKAPLTFVGPAVMGIGCFIVIVGIIMCLFETQVCKKKNGDSHPLISENMEDPEIKNSDPTAVPSTFHEHNHKRSSRKTTDSPKRNKTRHVKCHSKEKCRQKTPSPKSPPVSIEKPKCFMTSSEDEFLTPSNTLGGHHTLLNSTSRDAENQTSSSLMKSFTSSGPSWGQSTEFLTPCTSFKDTSVSLNNSVEIDEEREPENSTTKLSDKMHVNAEFMTPLTLEEEMVQQLLKNQDEKKVLESQVKEATEDKLSDTTENNSKSETNLENNDSESSKLQTNSTEEINRMPERENIYEGQLTHNAAYDALLASEDHEHNDNFNNAPSLKQIEDRSNISDKNLEDINNTEVTNKESDMDINTIDKKDFLLQNNQTEDSVVRSESRAVSLTNEKFSSTYSTEETLHGEISKCDKRGDFESSTSSDETIVSPNNSFEKEGSKEELGEKTTLPISKHDSKDILLKLDDTELTENAAYTKSDSYDHQSVPSSLTGKTVESETSGIIKLQEDKNIENISTDYSS